MRLVVVVAVPVEHGRVRRDAADRVEAREDGIRKRRRGGGEAPSGQKRPRRGAEHQRASQDPSGAAPLAEKRQRSAHEVWSFG